MGKLVCLSPIESIKARKASDEVQQVSCAEVKYVRSMALGFGKKKHGVDKPTTQGPPRSASSVFTNSLGGRP